MGYFWNGNDFFHEKKTKKKVEAVEVREVEMGEWRDKGEMRVHTKPRKVVKKALKEGRGSLSML